MTGEKRAVHVFQPGQQFIRVPLAAILWRIQHPEELFQSRSQIAAVLLRPVGDEVRENIPTEDAGVLREQAEKHPHQKHR